MDANTLRDIAQKLRDGIVEAEAKGQADPEQIGTPYPYEAGALKAVIWGAAMDLERHATVAELDADNGSEVAV